MRKFYCFPVWIIAVVLVSVTYIGLVSYPGIDSMLFLPVINISIADAQQSSFNQTQPADYVNTLIGTAPFEDEEYLGNNPPEGEELYCGSVVPGAMALDGVVKLGPDTGFDGIFHVRGSSYRFTDSSIMGFSHLHHEYNRYANILFMPVTGPVKTIPGSRDNPDEGYRSRKDNNRERGSAGYYTVFLSDYGIGVELTATKNCGFHRYVFPQSDQAHVLIDLSTVNFSPDIAHQQAASGQGDTMAGQPASQQYTIIQDANIEVLDDHRIEGWQKCDSYTVYFYAEFNKPFQAFGTWKDGSLHAGSSTESGFPIGAYVDFTTTGQEAVLARVGISLQDLETARQSLAREIPDWDFDQLRNQTKAEWNSILNRIEVEGGTRAERVNFYTALYRVLASQSYLGWPISGAVQSIIRPEWIAEQLAETRWRTSRGGFWGPSQASWIMGMYVRGFRDFDMTAAYDALRRSATDPNIGWERLADYMRWGYIPTDQPTTPGPLDFASGRPDVVNRTLGYAYEDYSIAQLAKTLDRKHDYEYFMARSANYRLLFDPATGFMRPRRPDGSWAAPFYPTVPYAQRFYREGTAWHYLWLVPHDIQGLIVMLGGRTAFISKLDELFNTPYNPEFPLRDVTGIIGQYCHGDETDRQVPYYYNYAGAPWKSQEIVRRIMEVLYKPVPGGLCGMDDNGLLSGWYVLSAMGFYPVEPTLGDYVIGSPIFPRMTIHLQGSGGNNGTFVIEAHDTSEDNRYIQSAVLNGKPLDRPYFNHSDLIQGGSLVFEMEASPNKQWGSAPDAAPPSVTPLLLENEQIP